MTGTSPAPRDPARDAKILAEVKAAVLAQNIPRAVELALAALASGLVDPMLLNLRSHYFASNGRDKDALNDLAQALSIAPDDVMVRNAYGFLLAQHQRWAEALEVLQEAIRIAPDYAPARFSVGWIRESTGELDEARRHYENALMLDPHFVEPLVRLASLARDRSDLGAARELADRALMIRPGDYGALTTLARVAIGEGELERAETIVRRLIAAQAPSPVDAALVRGVLGDLRHAQGRYSQAFAAYSAGNREKFKHYAPRFDDRVSNISDYCNWLTSYFETAPFAQWPVSEQRTIAGERDGATGHVFLVGFPRSGTTLLENVLAAHPQVCALDERDTLGAASAIFMVDEAGRQRLAALGFEDEEIIEQRRNYWRLVREFGIDPAGKIVIDKHPLKSIRLPLVAKFFPDAKILFAVRDPRDVVLSCFRRNFGMNASMFELLSLDRAARFYDATMRLATAYREKLGLDWHEHHFEALVDDFEGEARTVCDFIGIPWAVEMRDFAERAKTRTIRTPSSSQVVRGLNREGVGQWRNYRDELAPVMDILKPWVARFGYPAE